MGTKGTFKSIFWLDDQPDQIDWLGYGTGSNPANSLEELMSRITFAFDFNQAAELVTNKFDLYILDADFPDELHSCVRTYLTAWTTAIKAVDPRALMRLLEDFDAGLISGIRSERPTGISLSPEQKVAYDNFMRFHGQHLADKTKPVVVYSFSLIAAEHACRMRLPFYIKRAGGAKTVLEHISSAQIEQPDLITTGWEVGGWSELEERYLKS